MYLFGLFSPIHDEVISSKWNMDLHLKKYGLPIPGSHLFLRFLVHVHSPFFLLFVRCPLVRFIVNIQTQCSIVSGTDETKNISLQDSWLQQRNGNFLCFSYEGSVISVW